MQKKPKLANKMLQAFFPNFLSISRATIAGTHMHTHSQTSTKGLWESRFYIALVFTLQCHHRGNTNATQGPNIYPPVTHALVCTHTQYAPPPGRFMTLLTRFFLHLPVKMDVVHHAVG